MKLLLALLLAVDPGVQTVKQGKGKGTNEAWTVDCVNCTAGAASQLVYVVDAGPPLNINPPASLPLPTGASTGAKQDTANTSLSSLDGKTPALVSGRQPVDGSGVTQPISAAALPLPSGAATGTKQDTGNTSLSSIDGKLPALAGGKVPVDIGASIVSVTGGLTDTQLRATPLPVSGTVTASGPLTDTQLRASAVPVSGTVTASGPVTDTQLRATAVPVSLAVAPTTPITAAALPLPAGAATDSTLSQLLDGGVAQLATIAAELVNGTQTTKVTNLPPAPARNALTGAAYVDGSKAVQPVAISALPLPAGAATDAALVALLAAMISIAPVNVVAMPPPLNPFLPRCNAVRKTGCQP